MEERIAIMMIGESFELGFEAGKLVGALDIKTAMLKKDILPTWEGHNVNISAPRGASSNFFPRGQDVEEVNTLGSPCHSYHSSIDYSTQGKRDWNE